VYGKENPTSVIGVWKETLSEINQESIAISLATGGRGGANRDIKVG